MRKRQASRHINKEKRNARIMEETRLTVKANRHIERWSKIVLLQTTTSCMNGQLAICVGSAHMTPKPKNVTKIYAVMRKCGNSFRIPTLYTYAVFEETQL